MSGKDDTAKLYALDEDALRDMDDTDSIPALPDAAREPPQEKSSDSSNSGDKTVDSLDWLISITTTIDKRIERIEEELQHVKILLAEEQKKEAKPGKTMGSFLSDIRRRFK